MRFSTMLQILFGLFAPHSSIHASPAYTTAARIGTAGNGSARRLTRPAFASMWALAIVLPWTGGAAHAGPVSFNGTSAYTQDFQTLTGATSATATLSATTMTEISGLASIGGSSSVSGWYIYATGTGPKSGLGNGSATTGYVGELFDGATPSGRALGSLSTSSSIGNFGVVLQNGSGGVVNNVTIAFDAVMNRNPSTTANTYTFGYYTSATAPVTSSSTAAGSFGLSSASANAALNFTTPTTGTGSPGTQAAITPLFKFASPTSTITGLNWANNDYLYLFWKDADEGGSDAAAGIDNFSFSQLVARNLTWNAAGSGTWDTTTANWTTGSGATTFSNTADNVFFSDSTGGTITVAGTLTPLSTSIDAASGTYTFTAATPGTDKISGTTGITKSGAGVAVFTTANTYSGGTAINAGTVRISADGQLGTGAVSINGGTLESTAGGATTLTTALVVGSSGGAINTGSQDLTISGSSGLGGVLTKSGAGKLTLTGAITSNAGAGYNVAAGSLQLGTDATSTGVYKVFSSGTLTGNLIVSGVQRFDVNSGATLSGSGRLQFPATGALISTTSGDTGGTISAEIALNSGNAAFTPGSWSGTTYTPGSFITTIGATKGATTSLTNTLTVGVISGTADVDISNNSSTGGGGGITVLNGASTYTGNTTINTNAPDVAGTATVKLGVTNALPTTTGVIVGTRTGVGAPVLDMNGKNQQVAYLADGANVSGTKYLTITNAANSSSVLTIGGSITPGTAFSGKITDGTTGGTVQVVKAGSSSQTLSGASTYSGGTSIAAGTLVAGNVAAFGTGAVSVAGGTLDLGGFNVANAVTMNGGSLANAAAFSGALAIGGQVALTGTTAASVTVGSSGVLNGSGTVGAIQGAGLVAPGSSAAGILSAGSLNPAAGTSFAFELTQATPDYASITNSGNDVLRLTGGTPFASSLSSGNAVNVYLSQAALALGTLSGGFSTATQSDFLSSISAATFNYFVQDNGGSFSYNGQAYKTLADFSAGTTVNLSTIIVGSGQATQFVVVPEPSTIGLAVVGLGLAVLMRWRKRAAD